MELYLVKTSGMVLRYADIPEVYKGLYELPFSLLVAGSYAIVMKRQGEQPQVIGWVEKAAEEWAQLHEPICVITEDFCIVET